MNEIAYIKDTGYTYSGYVEMGRKLGLDISPLLRNRSNKRSYAQRVSKGHKWVFETSPRTGDKVFVVNSKDTEHALIYGVERLSDGRQFIISKNGLKFTGEHLDFFDNKDKDLFEI